jgi:tetratricopeptide (TPR) repeat protein
VLVEKVPYVAVALAATAVTLRMLGQFGHVRTLAQHGMTERTAQAAYGLSFYLWKTLVPVSLSPLYPLPPRLEPLEPRFVGSALLVLGVSITVFRVRRRWPWALAAWAGYVALLLPFLGFLQTGPQLVADRYAYLACLPWAVLLAGALARVGSSAVVAAVTAPALALLGLLAFQQTRVWHDSATLWEQALRVDAGNWVAYTNRAVTRERSGDRRGALDDYTTALRVHPGYPLAYANRGTLRQDLGDLDGAIADLTVATRLTPRDWRAWNNRGWARQAKGDMAGAIADYTQALQVAQRDLPGRSQIEQNLALVRAIAAAAR